MLDDVPLLAFTGGLVATVNPCGFAMLPAYLSFFLGLDDAGASRDRGNAVAQALRVGVLVAAGFVLVFGTAAALLTFGTRTLTASLPWAALVVGAAVAALGVWLLAGRALPVHLPAPARAGEGRSTTAVFGFGVGYAIASLSCTLPVFVAVVAGTATRQSFGSALAVFGVYAIGMALPLLAITVALAMGRDTLVRRARALARHTHRIAGGLLVLAGVYIVVFWSVELAGVRGGPVAAVVLFVERLSSRLTTLIGEQPVLWGSVFILVVVTAVALSKGSSRKPQQSPPAPTYESPPSSRKAPR